MLKTKIVFLDTETFISNNYGSGEKLKVLAKYGVKNVINIYLTKITEEEIRSNIKEDLDIAADQINQFKKDIHRKGRILRNLDGFKEYLELPKLNRKIDLSKINETFNYFIEKGNVEIIPYGKVELEPIFEKYFNREKPFGLGRKKYEFPDAFTLQSIENWCKINNKKAYLISGDKDVQEYKSEFIFPIKKLGDFLGIIYNQEKLDDEKFEWIEDKFISNQDLIGELIKEKFIENVNDEFYSEVRINEVWVDNIEFVDFQIIEERNMSFILQMDVHMYYRLDFSFTDYSNSYYDKEEGNYLFLDVKRKYLEFDEDVTVEIEIEADYKKRNDPDQEINFHCIYTGVPDEEMIENRSFF